MTLSRKVRHYIIIWYLPSGLFVIISWISFLIPPDNIPGRMGLLITVFLVLVNIFNYIISIMPKAERMTAVETYVIACILFVFGALLGNCKFKCQKSKLFLPSRVCRNIASNADWQLQDNEETTS